MRRKPGELVPIERSILAVAVRLHDDGVKEFHGFLIAKEIKDREGARLLTGYGTLYRALGRLRQMGLLCSWWEDPLVAAGQSRPRRRFYRLSGKGASLLSEAPSPKS